MDHLPRVEKSFLPPIEIPFFIKSKHIFGIDSDYFKFRADQGFENAKLVQGDYSIDGGKEDVLSIVQSWGFFGTLITVLKTVRVPFDVRHFVRVNEKGDKVVSTASLLNYLRIWVFHERSRLSTEAKEERGRKIKDVLTTLSEFVNGVLESEMQGSGYSSKDLTLHPDQVGEHGRMHLRAMQDQSEHSGGYHEFEKCIDDDYYDRNQNFFSGPMCGKGYEFEADGLNWNGKVMSPAHLLVLSLSLLGEALESARVLCYEDGPHIAFSTPLFVQALLQAAGWCPIDDQRVSEHSNTAVLSYLTAYDRRDSWEKHKGCCPKERCLAYQITDSVYKGRHVTPECECNYVSLQGEIDFIKTVIYEGHIPLVFVKTDEGQDELSLGLTAWGGETWTESFPFVAISHIWADGIGNTEENAIPECQLIKLQKVVDQLYGDEERLKPSIPFWIDTLMIPLEPEAKALAISRMDHVYSSADKVLVLDASLEDISVKHDPQELMMRIYLCPWMSRLWTLQEAFLARHLFFKFAEESLRIEDLAGEFRTKLLKEDLALLEEVRRKAEAEDKDDPGGYTFHQALNAMITARLIAYAKNDGAVTEHDDVVELYPIRTFVMNRMLFLRINAWNQAKMAELRAAGKFSFAQMAIPMHHRASSKAEDEPLCLALVAGVPVHELIQIPPDERMEQLFGQFDEIPSSIIFSEKQRIHKPARKWIPQSLLNSSNFYSGLPGKPTPDGLLVQFGGMLLGPVGDNSMFPCRHTAPEGLFYIQHETSWTLCRFKPKHYQLIPEQANGESCHQSGFEFLDSHSDFNYGHWELDGAALIFNVQNVREEFHGERDAAFVSVYRRKNDDDKRIFASFEFALKIWKVGQEAEPSREDLPIVAAVEVLDRQVWCVG